MTCLVDVNVICEPGKLRPNERVQKWLEQTNRWPRLIPLSWGRYGADHCSFPSDENATD